jgi:ankyrin repeat protein
MSRRAAVVVAALWLSSCGIERPPYGGDKESALATATLAVDAGTVARLLASGADPNRLVEVTGRKQSPWFLALNQLRAGKPGTVGLITAMLKAGANPNVAWGTDTTDPTRPPESRWRKFMSGSRVGGMGSSNPLWMVMMHPVPDAVRALVTAGIDPRLGQAALVSAIEQGQTNITHMLVDAGVDVNCHPGANTPLLAAIEARDVALMTYLEAHGAREKP